MFWEILEYCETFWDIREFCNILVCSGKFLGILADSGTFLDILGIRGSSVNFCEVLEHLGNSGTFVEILGHSGRFWEGLGHSGRFWDILGHSAMLGHSGLFWDFLGGSGTAGFKELEKLKEREQLSFTTEAGEIGPDPYDVTISKHKHSKKKPVVPPGVALMKGMTPGESSKIKEVRASVREEKDKTGKKDSKTDQEILQTLDFATVYTFRCIQFCSVAFFLRMKSQRQGRVLLRWGVLIAD
eukprot:s2646_g5.t1